MTPVYVAGFLITLVWVIREAAALRDTNALGVIEFICHLLACAVLFWASFFGYSFIGIR